MKRKILLLVPVAILAVSIALPAKAVPAWYAEAQMEITGFNFVGVVEQGYRFDVPFVGVAGGPNIKEGTVEGVDHLLIDWDEIAHLNVYLTITDNEGDEISARVTGLVVTRNPGQTVFENAQAEIIDMPGYHTNGKYFDLIGNTFRDEGFITELSMEPPGGYIHVKWYWD